LGVTSIYNLGKLYPNIARERHPTKNVKLESIYLATMVFTETQTKTHNQTFKKIICALKAYSKEYESFKKKLN
jgi:hypothetical protein